MGTSSSFGGAGAHSPLIPSWLQPDESFAPAGEGGEAPVLPPSNSSEPNQEAPQLAQPSAAPKVSPLPNRFKEPRGNYSRFALSGGGDREHLGKALSGYVAHSAGGASIASARMGRSKNVASATARFFAEVQREGVREALFKWRIEGDSSRRVSDTLLEVLNKMPFDGGPIDEAIARDSMVDSIIDNFDDLNVSFDEVDPAVFNVVLEDFVTKSIVAKIIMDIGVKGLYLAKDESAAQYIHDQLEDIVRGAVSDAFSINGGVDHVTADEFDLAVDQVYTDAFSFIQAYEETI